MAPIKLKASTCIGLAMVLIFSPLRSAIEFIGLLAKISLLPIGAILNTIIPLSSLAFSNNFLNNGVCSVVDSKVNNIASTRFLNMKGISRTQRASVYKPRLADIVTTISNVLIEAIVDLLLHP
ncbi:hypothetical protein ES705_50964 [subsurface metagenome]